jgi:hypothetical protein
MRLHRPPPCAASRSVSTSLFSFAIAASELGTEPKPIGKGIGSRLTVLSLKIDEYQLLRTKPDLLSDAREVKPHTGLRSLAKHFSLRRRQREKEHRNSLH